MALRTLQAKMHRGTTQPVQARIKHLAATVLLGLCLSYGNLASADQFSFSSARVVAIGDIHGAYDDLIALLQVNQIIDNNLQWSAGATHLVSLGDLVDRGAKSR